MEYFVLSQDQSICHPVEIDRSWLPDFWKNKLKKEGRLAWEPEEIPINKNYNFLVKSDKNHVYPDLLEIPVPLLSDKLKDIFLSYEKNIQCNCAILSDREKREQRVYWLLCLKKIDCIGEGTQFYPNSYLKKLVLDEKKIKNSKIFRVQNILEKKIIVNTDVAESILRRSFTGMVLEKVECIHL